MWKRRMEVWKAIVLFLMLASLAKAVPIGTTIGPYKVTRVLPPPPGGMGDIVFADEFLYSLENYDGIIHRLDPLTGNVLADYYVPGSSLHDNLPYDGPRGLAYDGNHFYMATYCPDYLRKLHLGTPPNVTIVSQTSLPGWPMDLTFSSTYVNGYLYYPEYLGPIRRIDPSTGAVVGSFSAPSKFIYAMTFDGENLIAAYGPGGPSRVFWVISTEDGSIQDTWTVSGWDDYIGGLAFDQTLNRLYVSTGSSILVAELEPVTHSMVTFSYEIPELGYFRVGDIMTLWVEVMPKELNWFVNDAFIMLACDDYEKVELKIPKAEVRLWHMQPGEEFSWLPYGEYKDVLEVIGGIKWISRACLIANPDVISIILELSQDIADLLGHLTSTGYEQGEPPTQEFISSPIPKFLVDVHPCHVFGYRFKVPIELKQEGDIFLKVHCSHIVQGHGYSGHSSEWKFSVAPVLDTDADGIPDDIENETGTDPFDDDTDNDGLLDGPGSGEDTNANGMVDPGETDPRNPDSDGDGIQDGTERGLVAPEGFDTDLTIFVTDVDPSSTTDPTNPDTDGDGLLDGEEDLNSNGAIDPGESDPAVTTPMPVDELVSVSMGRVGYERRTGKFSVNVTITNMSVAVIGSPAAIVIETISSPNVTVANADGITSDGKPYIELSGLLENGVLCPGESVATRVCFNNPNRVRFTFQPSVWGIILP